MPRSQRWLLGCSLLLALCLPLLLFPDPVVAAFASWAGFVLAGLAALPRGARLSPCLAMLALWVVAVVLLTHLTARGWTLPSPASLRSSLTFLAPPLALACVLLLFGALRARLGRAG